MMKPIVCKMLIFGLLDRSLVLSNWLRCKSSSFLWLTVSATAIFWVAQGILHDRGVELFWTLGGSGMLRI